MQASRLLSLSPSSPSFNSYSSVNLVEIAARVVEELRIQDDSQSELDEWAQQDQNDDVVDDDKEGEDDFDFNFAFVCKEPDSTPVSADEIFYKGQIKPTYPYADFLSNDSRDDQVIFNGNSLTNGTTTKTTSSPLRSPLRKLFSEETSSSCSSSEADELDAVPPETYCVWTPKRTNNGDRHQESSAAGRCKKSNSTGSSKRWRLRDLMHRSNSDGKDTFVFLAPRKKNAERVNGIGEEEEEEEEEKKEEKEEKAVLKEHKHSYYMRSSRGGINVKEGDDNKRRSYLPYRQDLMGGFSNVNGVSRNLHPF